MAETKPNHYVINIEIKKITFSEKKVSSGLAQNIVVDRNVEGVLHLVQNSESLEGAIEAVRRHMDVVL